MSKTKIEWADKVWNPVTGCTKVSAGCKNCYAERMSKRLAGRCGYPKDGFKVTLHHDKLGEPLRWKKPSRIFVCSMGDLFHKDVPDEFICKVLSVILEASQHTFLILTKRPQRMHAFLNWLKVLWANSPIRPDTPLPTNLLFGVSVEDQKTVDERLYWLMKLKELFPLKTFVSYEPALGPVDFEPYLLPQCRVTREEHEAEHAGGEFCTETCLDWLIMGGETGPGARPMHPEWARSVRDQCKAAGVAFFFKQWGEWIEVPDEDEKPGDIIINCHDYRTVARMRRVGKIAAGCLLDGEEHKEVV